MRLKRRTRRLLATAAAVIYVAAILWALSPLIASAPRERDASTSVRNVSGASSLGALSVAPAPEVPERLPGSTVVEANGSFEEPASEATASEAEYTEPASESAAPTEAGGSTQSSSSSSGSGGEGSGETVIGFEG